MNRIFEKIRAFFFFAVTLTAMSLCVVTLMKIQIVDGGNYNERVQNIRTVTQVITSPRGEIIDINGVEIMSNKVGYNVLIEAAFFPSDKQERNRIVNDIAAILKKGGVEWIDSLPITKTAPFEFLPDRESDIAKLRQNIVVQPYATADDCINAMIMNFEISDEYTTDEVRTIAGILHEMILRDFSLRNRYTLAEDIPMDMVVKLKEAAFSLDGMDIAEAPVRACLVSDAAPHIIGTSSVISPEEHEILRDTKGYTRTDIIGKSGVELAMEDYLRGVKGLRTIELLNGAVISDTVTEDAIPGNTVRLTIDADYQRKVQQILDNHIYFLQNQTASGAKGTRAKGGALVVLNAKTGALLAAATSPTYDLNDYIYDYDKVRNSSEHSPLLNRATSGLYRPGSTYKMVTATAAMNEGLATNHSTVYCGRVYTYWSGYTPGCTGWHGNIAVVSAIHKSCNIYFYHYGRLLGADKIAEYASYFGLGEFTGIEIAERQGFIATPETLARQNREWQAGLVVQAAIGQSETAVTPLQMAVYASTLANNGTRLTPYVVDSVYSYNRDEVIFTTQTTAVNTIPDPTGYAFSSILQGMKLAGDFGQLAYPSERTYWAPYVLSALPEKTALKTGTPQMTSATDTGTAFVGFYPADDPVLAFSGFVEHGDYGRLMIRSMIEAYYDKEHVIPDIRPQTQSSDNSEPLTDEG
ncbi:MAG: penicillin-binding transpeptidase domain-containing protein [Oscillospiraceae bacterium]|nr:penicillin-binding transpeptidase domain-containing protein [Oscillospiraceae bacterium]